MDESSDIGRLTFGSASQHFFISSAKLAGQLVGMVSLWTHNNDRFRSFVVKRSLVLVLVLQNHRRQKQLLSAKDENLNLFKLD